MTAPGTDHVGKLPGTCGHHCGIRSVAEGGRSWEGHCGCPECRCPIAVTPAALGQPAPRGWPMCWGTPPVDAAR